MPNYKIKFALTILGSFFLSCAIFDSTTTNKEVTKLYVTLQQLDQIAVYDTPDLTLLKIIDVDFMGASVLDMPHFIVLDEQNGYWFVTTVESDYVAQYSLKTDALIDTIYVGDYPALMALNSDSNKLYVSRMMMDAETYVINEIDYGGEELSISRNFHLNSPILHGITIDMAKKYIFTISNEADWIYRIELESGDTSSVSMDFNNRTQNARNNIFQPIQCISLNDNLIAISCSAFKDTVNGQVQVWNGENLTLNAIYEFGPDSRPWHIVKSPVKEELFVVLGGKTGNGGIACLTYNENNIELKWQYMNISFNVLHGITVDALGKYLYVSGRGNHYLYQIDADRGILIDSVPLGAENQIVSPGGITVMQSICSDCE